MPVSDDEQTFWRKWIRTTLMWVFPSDMQTVSDLSDLFGCATPTDTANGGLSMRNRRVDRWTTGNS